MSKLHRTLLPLCLGLVLPAFAVAQGRAKFVEGVRLLEAGDAVAALEQLRAAEDAYGEEVPATLLQNLAWAAWHSGEAAAAEAYAERAAARDAALAVLRDSIVGAARLTEGKKAMAATALDPAAKAADRAVQAFESALTKAPGRAELRRNLARALELQRQIEELRKQQKQQDEDDKGDQQGEQSEGEKQDPQKQDSDSRDDQQKKSGGEDPQQEQKDPSKQDPEKQDPEKQDPKQPPKPGEGQEEAPPEPSSQKPDESGQGEQDPGAGKPKDSPEGGQPEPQPGTGEKGAEQPAEAPRELSEEEKQRLLSRLQRLIQDAQQRRSNDGARHKPGKKDW